MRVWIIGPLVVLVLIVVWGAGLRLGLYGEHRGPGVITGAAVDPAIVADRRRAQARASSRIYTGPTREILFGDLHVHSTFSLDAFARSLPLMGGNEGAHPVADACDYARYCSALDFWSINDHAEASTPRRWRETVDTIRQCNEVAGDPADPDVVSYLGWEWSQVGVTPEDHYGHKNVVYRGLSDAEIPTRPIGAGGLATDALRGRGVPVSWMLPLLDLPNRHDYYDALEFLAEAARVPDCEKGVPSDQLPADCYESADTPAELFEKLRQWERDVMVIPHGNAWGLYSPPGISWDKQLAGEMHDPRLQGVIEVYSGHGNSEEHRGWRAVLGDAENFWCPRPSHDFLPMCWQAGEIIRDRCLEAGESDAECELRAEKARLDFLNLGAGGHVTITGSRITDWLDAGQCRDCFLPAYNLRPGGSVQYGLAISSFAGGEPRRFRWGFIGSSDNHSARPGTGYKEYGRRMNTEASGLQSEFLDRLRQRNWQPEPFSVPMTREEAIRDNARLLFVERQASFFTTGGLAAVHSEGRSREAIWDAMQRKEIYATSGDRILLWFNLLNAERPDGSFGAVPMGGEARLAGAPRFEVRAVGALEQKPGCPDHAVRGLPAERLAKLCAGECFNPSDTRKEIVRIEVVRIRPQAEAGESVTSLIEDPWRIIPCGQGTSGCVVQFEDPEFAAAGRDTLYYARAIQGPEPRINAANLRCKRRDASGACLEVDPCYGDYRTPREEECLAPSAQRAWSSPIFVDFAGSPPVLAGAP